MSSTARAVYLPCPGELEIREFDLPRIGPHDGLLRVELGGVCGTDVKIFRGAYQGRIGYPLIPGHEICGVVEEIGDEAAERWGVEAGTRVAVDSFLVCGACEACLDGDNRYCATLGDYGVSMGADRPPHLWGGFATHLYLAPGAQVHVLPPGLSVAHGVLVPAVVSNALRWVGDVGGVTVGSTVAIIGPGPIGLAAVFVARALGAARVIVSGLPTDERRLALARRLGADATPLAGEETLAEVRRATAGAGVDVVVDVSGAPAALSVAAELVRRQGRIVVGGLTGGRQASLPIDRLAVDEISLHGVFSHDRASVRRGLEVVARSPEPFDEFVTHTFGLDDFPSAIDAVAQAGDDVVKVVVDPWR
jgi:alcohol dehydrogenase